MTNKINVKYDFQEGSLKETNSTKDTLLLSFLLPDFHCVDARAGVTTIIRNHKVTLKIVD